MRSDTLLSSIIDRKSTCVFISPHLDDAILSAGSLILYLHDKVPIKIITVFTEASPFPYSNFASGFLQTCGYSNADTLFSIRKQEDIRISRELRTSYHHLGFVDAAWRKNTLHPVLQSLYSKFHSPLLFQYPTGVVGKRMHKSDHPLVSDIYSEISRIIGKKGNYVVFAPLAVGLHIDHYIVRMMCETYFPRCVYWVDFPYILHSSPDAEFVKKQHLQMVQWKENSKLRSAKISLIAKYTSQLISLFPDGKILTSSEAFYS